MAAQNPNPAPMNGPPMLHIPPRQFVMNLEQSDTHSDSFVDPSFFKVVIMQCTASIHAGTASVILERRGIPWFLLPDCFVASAIAASSDCPIQQLILKHHSLSNLPLNFSSPATMLPTSLSTLDLSNNCFVSVPIVVCDLVNLQELYLSNNGIVSLPNAFSSLKHLKALYLQNNYLKKLSIGVCGLQSLVYLNVEHNELTTLSSEVSQLTNLKVLHASSNKMEYLPDSINDLSNLQELYLSQNQLKVLPDKLDGLSSLSQLQLANNKLDCLPLSFVDLKSLKSFTLSGNNLKFPPLSACRAGVEHLKTFMRNNCSSSHYCEPEHSDSGEDTPFEDIDD